MIARTTTNSSISWLFALMLVTPAALADEAKSDKAQIRGAFPVAPAAPKSPVPTRDTIRPLSKPGALLLGDPKTPGETKVSYYYRKYEQAFKGLVQTSSAYRQKKSECEARGFVPNEQVSAGCKPADTVAECSDKILVWCTAEARKSYDSSLLEISAALRRLSKEAAQEADLRASYLRMR
jgi:hypothetical protein